MERTVQDKKKEGFTLLELLVTVAILAVFLTILIPSVNSYVKHAKEVRAKTEAQAVCQAVALYLLDHEMEDSQPESWELAMTVCVPIEEGVSHALTPYLEGDTKVNGTVVSLYYNGTMESYEGILYQTDSCLVEAKMNGSVEVIKKE